MVGLAPLARQISGPLLSSVLSHHASHHTLSIRRAEMRRSTCAQIARVASAPAASSSRPASALLHRARALDRSRTLWSSSKPSSTAQTAEPDSQLRAEQSAGADGAAAGSAGSAETVTPSESDFADAAAASGAAAGQAAGAAASGAASGTAPATDAHAAALEAKDREIARLKVRSRDIDGLCEAAARPLR